MNVPASSRTSAHDARAQRLERIREVVDARIRPELNADGGDVEVVGIDEDDIVQIRLLGACQGCVSSVHTTTMLVEKAVKAEVPEVRFLEAIP
jgi:Fe-S cluster biogenesis protein NfuA